MLLPGGKTPGPVASGSKETVRSSCSRSCSYCVTTPLLRGYCAWGGRGSPEIQVT